MFWKRFIFIATLLLLTCPQRAMAHDGLRGTVKNSESSTGLRGGPLWQLTFRYDQFGIELVSSKPITKAKRNIKRVITPGLFGSPVRYHYHLSWLDRRRRISSSSEIAIPVGVLSAPQSDLPCESSIGK